MSCEAYTIVCPITTEYTHRVINPLHHCGHGVTEDIGTKQCMWKSVHLLNIKYNQYFHNTGTIFDQKQWTGQKWQKKTDTQNIKKTQQTNDNTDNNIYHSKAIKILPRFHQPVV